MTTISKLSFVDAMKLDPADYEPREVGDWKIEHHTVTEDDAKLHRLQAMVSGHGRYSPPGTYIGIRRKGTLVMSNVPDEMRDHATAYYQAQRLGGRVLIHGLGIGMVLTAMLRLPQVEHVDVVELSPDVIELVGPVFADDIAAGRLTIHQDDCLTKKWPVGTKWSVVWHDIWDTISSDNLPQMQKLHRSFGNRCEWQGSWCKHECQRLGGVYGGLY